MNERADQRAAAQDRFTRAVTAWCRKTWNLDVVVVESMDRPDGLDVIRVDGQEFTPAEARALAGWRLGYAVLGGRF